jgi:hypothetical protein|tara:strand:+ start:4380 stop:6029 length:1650 start_codon:yes stop_codon:yes gene_type:complete
MTANTGSRGSEEQAKVSSFDGPGPYVAIVRNHLDTEYMGRIEVELLKTTTEGNIPNAAGEVVPVSYLSPFYGVTPYAGTGENDTFAYTQKSYGFWAVPPDIGTKVLVIFAEGNKGNGYWIGCIQDQYMNFMVPGNASTSYNNEDQSKIVPVGEYNKRTEEAVGNNPTQFIKPVNTDAVNVLTTNGLLTDQIRGTTSSSARREVPSMVFGWSSPGPLDRRPGAPKVSTGATGSQIEMPASRLTGSSIVMDDGDASLFRVGKASETPSKYATLADGGDPTIPASELFRIRTRTGHQILLHNSEDLIYIAHGSGKSWIEMTANGKIDIYAEDSISMHTGADFNFKADRNINFEAGGNINMKAANTMSTQTGANWNVLCGADGKLTCSGTSNIVSSGHRETAGTINMNSGGAAAAAADAAQVPTRVPLAAPYTGAENKNPAEHTSAKTNNDPAAVAAGTANATEATAADETSSDTFGKCVSDEPVATEAPAATNTDATLTSTNTAPAYSGPGSSVGTGGTDTSTNTAPAYSGPGSSVGTGGTATLTTPNSGAR